MVVLNARVPRGHVAIPVLRPDLYTRVYMASTCPGLYPDTAFSLNSVFVRDFDAHNLPVLVAILAILARVGAFVELDGD